MAQGVIKDLVGSFHLFCSASLGMLPCVSGSSICPLRMATAFPGIISSGHLIKGRVKEHFSWRWTPPSPSWSRLPFFPSHWTELHHLLWLSHWQGEWIGHKWFGLFSLTAEKLVLCQEEKVEKCLPSLS